MHKHTLPLSVGPRLYQAVSGLSLDAWLAPLPHLDGTLRRAEAALCALRNCGSLAEYQEKLSQGTGGGGPCTCVWTAGTIAYRCHTCGLTPSTAICVDCFRASDHQGHDIQMYTSQAGGCCDCGDLSSWRASGCCSRHRPCGGGQGAQGGDEALPPTDEAIARGIIGCALARLQLTLEGVAKPSGSDTSDAEAAFRLLRWLSQLAQHPALRVLMCNMLMEPAAPSVAAQAASLAATMHLPQEVATVTRMLQQQRTGLLGKLEQQLPALKPEVTKTVQPAAAAALQRRRVLPPANAVPEPPALLFWQLSTLLPLAAEPQLCEELATLHTLLLYCVPFKEAYGRLLLPFYPHVGALGKRHPVTKALDRLTVQIFHLEETCVALAHSDRLLEVLLSSLLDVVNRAVDSDGRLDGDSPELDGRYYLRIASDLAMVLSHPSLALLLLGGTMPASSEGSAQDCSSGGRVCGQEGHIFGSLFLEVFRKIEGASPVVRKLGEHVEYESTGYLNIVQLEVHSMHLLKQSALHAVLKAAEAGSMPAERAAEALSYGLHESLMAVEQLAGPTQAAVDHNEFWRDVHLGFGQMSAHIPLERLAASFLAGLLHLASVSSCPGVYVAVLDRALGQGNTQPAGEKAALQRRWQMCGLSAMRVMEWMRQIRERMWVRNGQEVMRLEGFYSSPFWSDHGMDCDVVAVQAWLASAPNAHRALGLVFPDTHKALLGTPSTKTLVLCAQYLHQYESALSSCGAWMRFMVQLLREQSVWHPTYSPVPLRRAVVHSLAVGPRSRTDIADDLPFEMAHSTQLDQVLNRVADYQPPTAASTGCYRLKPQCWKEFDPFYLRYTRSQMQSARHNAQESKFCPPEAQLELGMPPLPGAMQRLLGLLPHLAHLACVALLTACFTRVNVTSSGEGDNASSSAGAVEDFAFAAFNLIALAMQHNASSMQVLVGSAPGAVRSGIGPSADAAAMSPAAGYSSKMSQPVLEAPLPFSLNVLTGREPWLDGTMHEASPELKRCAAALSDKVQQISGPQQQPNAGRAAALPSTAAQQEVVAGAGKRVQHDEAQPEQVQHTDRRAVAKQRQQAMLARMHAQQARAAAALLGEESKQNDLTAQLEATDEAGNMDSNVLAQQQTEHKKAELQHQLPAHHPAVWERAQGTECALCHQDSEAAPLGLVAQIAVTDLPVLAAVDPPAPLTPQHPGLPSGAVTAETLTGSSASEHAMLDESTPAAAEAFPTNGMGPRLSVFDCQPSLHILCCGHTFHATCLERYRQSWHERAARGTFVEGFHQLHPSSLIGEFLCPICRRLGNCLLPLAALTAASGPNSRAAGKRERQESVSPLTAQLALQQLKELTDSTHWVSAPTTENQQLVAEWRAMDSDEQLLADQGSAAAKLSDEARRLLPLLGCHAAGVSAFCRVARLSCGRWQQKQRRVLDWLATKAAKSSEQHELLWGIPVMPVAPPPTSAGSHLTSLAQQMAEAADAQVSDQALGAMLEVAQAGLQLMEEAEESEDEFNEDEAAIPADEVEAFAVLTTTLRQMQEDAAERQLQDQAPAAADVAAVFRLEQQHISRTCADGNAGGLLWCLLGSGVAQWEACHRDVTCQPASDADVAGWRALQSLVQLALATGSTTISCHAALAWLQQQVLRPEGAPLELAAHPDLLASLLPRLLQLQLPPATGTLLLGQDPFLLLLTLMAAYGSRPTGEAAGLSCTSHKQPAAILQALVACLYPMAAGQAAWLATSGANAVYDISTAMSASKPLAQAVEGAVASHLIPWLQRCIVFLALVSGGQPPPSPALLGNNGAIIAAALLEQLSLPTVAEALRSPAARSLVPLQPNACSISGAVELSLRAINQHWSVVSPPLPVAPSMLQLPATYQDWYLSLGAKRCSACGQTPSEPALCLRCGAIVCCGSRRCKGPSQQGMCCTHAQACGGGTCLFLLIKLTRLLVIRASRASFLPSPYVDTHGEEDARLQRGKPLALHIERARRFLQLWRGGAWDFDSGVLHSANGRGEDASAY